MLVALLFADHDKKLAFKNLEWMKEIGVGKFHELLIVCPSGVSEQDAQGALIIGKQAFSKATLCHLSDDCDTGWPFGPNFMFRRTVDYVAHFNLYPFLLLESDAWLLYEDSLDAIEEQYEQAVSKGLVFMGYKENEGKSGEHMNGVAVYGNINIHAPTALSAPWPQERSQIGQNKMAFDMAGASEVVPKMLNSRLFQFQYKQEERLLKDESLSFLNPDAKIFHTDKTGRLVDLLRARKNADKLLDPNFDPLSEIKQKNGLDSQREEEVEETRYSKVGVYAAHNYDIFIKTYPRDKMWHEKCLESVALNCSGFRAIVEDCDQIDGDNYLYQQVAKLNADTKSTADYFLVTDSDTLFTVKITPDTFFSGSKSIWYYAPKEEVLAADSGTKKWFDCMERFLGVAPQHEFMRRQPFFVPRWLLQAFRSFCWRKHGMSVRDYVMQQQYFSEWNCLGFYAYTYHRGAFEWKTDGPVVCRQFWSPYNQSDADRQALFEKALPEINNILGVKEGPKIEHPASRPIKPSDGWSAIEKPEARMDLASEMLRKESEEEIKKRKLHERMAKARAGRKPKAVA